MNPEPENIVISADTESVSCPTCVPYLNKPNLIWKLFTRDDIASTKTLQLIILKLTATSVLFQAENFKSDLCISLIPSTVTPSTILNIN